MGKRRRVSGTEKGIKCADQHICMDRISVLPDDLLRYILSFMTVKEAAATSVFSSRWRYLWTLIPKLDLNQRELLLKAELSEGKRMVTLFNKGRSAYVKWVNHVLALHKNSNIEEFKVFFPLNKVHKRSIGKWIRYALSRKVQRLELNFTNKIYGGTVYDTFYTFPYELMCSDHKRDFSNLKSIFMKYVNVSGEALEFFLCNCPLLENLSVTESGDLLSLRIDGALCPSLKRLKISKCHKLEFVEIRGSNLVYLKYKGSKIDFRLENVSRLVEVFIGGTFTERMENIVLLLSSYLPLLEIFTIEFYNPEVSWEETKKLCSAVKMINLKQLVVKAHAYEDFSLLPLTNLIRASPYLQRFVLKTLWGWEPEVVERKVKKVTKNKYVHLKELEFLGYYGRISDLELIMHFLENSVSLEKIVVDPRDVTRPPLFFKEEVEEDEREVRTRVVKQLKNKVASPVNLTII